MRIEKQKAMTLTKMPVDLPAVCDRGTKISSKTAKAIKNHGMVINFTLIVLMDTSRSHHC